MARKLPVLQRALGAPVLFSVAYGEIASSIYFALGIIAGHALGLTPEVLLIAGFLFLLVALSYAEGTAAIPETGGAATLVRKAFNDLAGFCTGWVLFLDYVIVIAISALFLPHYLGGALQIDALDDRPWDVVVGVLVIAGIALVRLFRRPGLYLIGIAVAVLDLVTQILIVVLGLAFLFTPDALSEGVTIGSEPGWSDLAFALPLAMLAYTGLETVANLAEEARQSRRRHQARPAERDRRRRHALRRDRDRRPVGVPGRAGEHRSSATPGCSRRCSASSTRSAPTFRPLLADALRVFVGISGALILLAAATTSFSGFGRLAYSLGEHGMLPRPFGLLGRRTLIAPASIAAIVVIAIGGLVAVTAVARGRGRVPRSPLQLRRAAGVHRRAARRDPASLHRARAREALPRALERSRARRRRPDSVRDRLPPDLGRLRGGDDHAPGSAVRGADLARGGARRLRPRPPPPRRGAARDA